VSENHQEIIDEQIRIVEKAQSSLLYMLDHQPQIRVELEKLKKGFSEMCEELHNKGEKPSKEDYNTFYEALRALYSQLMGPIPLIKVMEHGLNVIRPKTMAQYNFVKQETNQGPTYRIEIVKPNDSRHKVETEPEAK